MAGKMTWKEIKRQYPDQWVSLCNLEYDEGGEVERAIVIAAGTDLKMVATESKGKEFPGTHSFQYTGKIKPFLGLAAWTIEDVPKIDS